MANDKATTLIHIEIRLFLQFAQPVSSITNHNVGICFWKCLFSISSKDAFVFIYSRILLSHLQVSLSRVHISGMHMLSHKKISQKSHVSQYIIFINKCNLYELQSEAVCTESRDHARKTSWNKITLLINRRCRHGVFTIFFSRNFSVVWGGTHCTRCILSNEGYCYALNTDTLWWILSHIISLVLVACLARAFFVYSTFIQD